MTQVPVCVAVCGHCGNGIHECGCDRLAHDLGVQGEEEVMLDAGQIARLQSDGYVLEERPGQLPLLRPTTAEEEGRARFDSVATAACTG